PASVHVNQDRYDLAFRVGMDAPVLGAALTANRYRGRPPGEIETKLFLESFAELVALQLVEEFAERRSIRKLRDGKASALGDLWVVGVDFRARLRANKGGNDEILEGLARQRRGSQGVEVEIAQSHLTGSNHRWRLMRFHIAPCSRFFDNAGFIAKSRYPPFSHPALDCRLLNGGTRPVKSSRDRPSRASCSRAR